MRQHAEVKANAEYAALVLEAFDLLDSLRRFHRRRSRGDFRAPNGAHRNFEVRCEAILAGHLQTAVRLRKEASK
jgi:hypothetical protein